MIFIPALNCSEESEYGSLSGLSSSEGNEEENKKAVLYNDSIKLVPTEEEAAEYLEQLALEEEEEQTLLNRFSGEEGVRDWYVDVLKALLQRQECCKSDY